MATKNKRIAAYVPESVYERYQSFRVEKELGDSQALIQILSEYFGVGHPDPSGSSLTLVERVARLEELIQPPLPAPPLAAAPNPVPIDAAPRLDLSISSPGQLSFLGDEESKSPCETGEPPLDADGGRWLTSRQAYKEAALRGCSRNEEGFKKWSAKHPDQCLKDFQLRRLKNLTSRNTAPSFEDMKYLDTVQVESSQVGFDDTAAPTIPAEAVDF